MSTSGSIPSRTWSASSPAPWARPSSTRRRRSSPPIPASGRTRWSSRCRSRRRWARCAADRPRSFDGVRIAQGLAATLDLDLDAARIAQLLVDLQRFVRAVHLVPIDAPDHVAVLDSDLRVQRVGHDGEELESIGDAVLERGLDARLGREIGEVGERAVELAPRDYVPSLRYLARPAGVPAVHRSQAAGVDVLVHTVVIEQHALLLDLVDAGVLVLVAHRVDLRLVQVRVGDLAERVEAGISDRGADQCPMQGRAHRDPVPYARAVEVLRNLGGRLREGDVE